MNNNLSTVSSVQSGSSGVSKRPLKIKLVKNHLIEEEKQFQNALQRIGPDTMASYTSTTSENTRPDDILRLSPRSDDHLLQRIAELEQTVFDQAQQIRNLQGVVNTSNMNIQNLNDLIQLKNGIINNLQSQQDRQLQCLNCLTADTRVQDLLQQVTAKEDSLKSLQTNLVYLNKELLDSSNRQQETLARHALEIKSREDIINTLKADLVKSKLPSPVQLVESQQRKRDQLIKYEGCYYTPKEFQVSPQPSFYTQKTPCSVYQKQLNRYELLHGEYTELYTNGRCAKSFRFDNGLLEGECKEFYSNGQTSRECVYVAGLIQGEDKHWHQNGKPQQITFYKDSIKNGEFKTWHEDGHVATLGAYKDDKLEGSFKAWNTKGELTSYIFYTAGQRSPGYKYYSDKPDLIQSYSDSKIEKTWYTNGQLQRTSNRKNGHYNGEYMIWYPNGQLQSKGVYKNDQYDGDYQTWSENGQILTLMTYKDGKYEGAFKRWHQNGQISQTGIYENGRLEGEIIDWSADGVQLACHTYSKGLRIGPQKDWHGNGKPRLICSHAAQNLEGYKYEGEYQEWFQDGQPKLHCFYKQTQLEGKYQSWYNDGQPQSERFYSHGQFEWTDYKEWHFNGLLSKQKQMSTHDTPGFLRTWDSNGKIVYDRKFCVLPVTKSLDNDLIDLN